ncbi:MAG: calcium-binding protein, partial [Chloroflexia bacterium]|nr:calcium-binding protein [Chloroflexia bacterium]
LLLGGAGDDEISGGSGSDELDGGPDIDDCMGGSGDNVFEGCETQS